MTIFNSYVSLPEGNLIPGFGMFWGWSDQIQDSSAAVEPVVLMSIGVDLEDLHRTEVTENHDFLPHLPPDLPESPEGTGWGWGKRSPSRNSLENQGKSSTDVYFNEKLGVPCKVELLQGRSSSRNVSNLGTQRNLQYIDGKSANPPISA